MMFQKPAITQEVKYGDGPPGKAGRDGRDGKDGRGISVEIAGTDLIATYTDGVVENVGRVVGRDGKDGKDGVGRQGDKGDDGKDGQSIKGDTGRGIVQSRIDGVDLVVEYTDGTHDITGRVVGRDGKDGKDGTDGKDGRDGIIAKDGKDGKNGKDAREVDFHIDDAGNLVATYSDGMVKILGHVRGMDGKDGKDGVGLQGDKGDDGKDGKDAIVVGGYRPPAGRVLFGKNGRLTSDRKPPGPSNTLNIPDNFARAVTLLITDGTGAGAEISGILTRGDGQDTTVWTEWRRNGSAAVNVSADTINGGIVVEATTPGNWTCRMIGSPE